MCIYQVRMPHNGKHPFALTNACLPRGLPPCLLQTPGSIVITADYVDFVEVSTSTPAVRGCKQQQQQQGLSARG